MFLQQHFFGTLGGTSVGAASRCILRVAELVLKLLFLGIFSSAEKERGHPLDLADKICNGPIFWTFLCFIFMFVFSILLFVLYYIKLESPARFASSFITDNMLIYNLTSYNVKIIVLEVVGES